MTKRKCKHLNTLTFDYSTSVTGRFTIKLCLDCNIAIVATSDVEEVTLEELKRKLNEVGKK